MAFVKINIKRRGDAYTAFVNTDYIKLLEDISDWENPRETAEAHMTMDNDVRYVIDSQSYHAIIEATKECFIVMSHDLGEIDAN